MIAVKASLEKLTTLICQRCRKNAKTRLLLLNMHVVTTLLFGIVMYIKKLLVSDAKVGEYIGKYRALHYNIIIVLLSVSERV